MTKIIYVVLVAAVTACCHNKTTTTPSGTTAYVPDTETKANIPDCVQRLIDEATKEQPPNPPLQVDEYLYNKRKVFLLTAPCCDQFNIVYDENCKKICAPTGGITGRGDMQCNDFTEKATFVKQLWKNTDANK